MSVEVTTKPSFDHKAPKELFPVPPGVIFFDVSRDARRFLLTIPTGTEGAQVPFQMRLDWTAMLKK